jgi:hypothetical protein
VVGKEGPKIKGKNYIPNLGIHSVNLADKENTNIPSYRKTIYLPMCSKCRMKLKCDGYNRNDFEKFGIGEVKHISY